MFEILPYSVSFETELMEMIRAEGEDWAVYWREPNATLYRQALRRSITFVALCNGKVCGYSRSMQDALYIYVCDLLVTGSARGNGLGEKLMRCLKESCPGCPVYVMSGNDEYYEKLGYRREGSLYLQP